MTATTLTANTQSEVETLRTALDRLSRHPLEKAIAALKECEKEIYVWVVTSPDGSENVSLRVGYAQAVEWAVDYANRHGKGFVPMFYSGSEVFLGYPCVK